MYRTGCMYYDEYELTAMLEELEVRRVVHADMPKIAFWIG